MQCSFTSATPVRTLPRRLLLLLLFVLLSSCSSAHEIAVPASRVIVPSQLVDVSAISFLSTGRLVVASDNDQIWYQTPGHHDWQQLTIDTQPPCIGKGYMQARVLPDSRLGMYCARELKHSRIYTTPVAYDWLSGSVEPLFSAALPDYGSVVWKQDMQEGIFASTGSYSTLYRITDTTIKPLPITLTDGQHSWFMPESVDAKVQYEQGLIDYRDPHKVGNVGDVTWSPDGQQIAFWATLETIGRRSSPLQRRAWDIYLLNTATLTTRRIPLHVYDAFRLIWAPQGDWLAYIAPADGIWLLNLATEQATRIQRGRFKDIAWSPDGQQLAAIKCNEDLCGDGKVTPEVWVYDVNSVITP